MRSPALLAPIFLICSLSALLRAAELPPPIVLDKAEVLQRLSAHNAKLSVSGGAAGVEFAKVDWPNVKFEAGKAFTQTDWSNVGAIVLEVRNPDSVPLDTHIRLDAGSDDAKFVRQGWATVPAGQRATLVCATVSEAEGMRAGPPVEAPAGAVRMKMSGPFPSEARVTAFQIFLNKPDRPRRLEVFAVRFAARVELKGIVDRYGQYTRGTWPGKVISDEDLSRAKVEEDRWLKEHGAAGDRDEFGGWRSGPQLKATGFFRVERVEGRWWLVTPSGHLFWSVGSTCVRPESSGPIRGRESMFTWLPDGASKAGWADFYQENLRRKYGESWKEQWAQKAVTRLPAWGFNTIANWSHDSVFKLHRVPFTASIHFGGLPAIGPRPAPGKVDHRLQDFFDESFPKVADSAIAKQTAAWLGDPWCIGYFVHNELHWDSWAGGDCVLTRHALAAPPTLAARKALVTMLREKYGSIEALNKAWGISMTDWDQPITLTAKQFNAAARADSSTFLTMMAERYFTVVSAAMKKHAPQQLYLGCPFAIKPPEVVKASAKYCDVVSFNIYADSVDPKQWAYLGELQKPVIIGEFHFGATDRGMFHTGLRPTASQAERAKAYAAYVRSAAAMPMIVGCHWFQFVDQPLTGRFDGENYNIGLVSITDAPYPELREAAREANFKVYELHRQAVVRPGD